MLLNLKQTMAQRLLLRTLNKVLSTRTLITFSVKLINELLPSSPSSEETASDDDKLHGFEAYVKTC